VTVDWQIYKPSTGIAIPEFISKLQIAERVHPNVMAGNLIILASALLGAGYFAWRNFSAWEKTTLLAAGLSGILIVLQSGSRGALFALSIAVGLALLLRSRILGVVYFLLSGAAGAAFAAGNLAAIHQAVNQVDGRAVSLALRLEIWARALDILHDSPLTGVGMGVFGAVLDKLYPLFKSAPGTILHAHNLYLQIAADLGLPGLIAWLAILLTTVWACWECFRRSPSGSLTSGFAAGLLVAQAALAAHGLFDAVTWGIVRTAPVVWALWGLAIALQSTTRNTTSNHADST
jgi:putative inorganic carbon (HCO3(-)) transporter